jgi:prolyl-tRNA synthetase
VAESWIGKVAGEREEIRKVHTPDKRTIDQVSVFLGVSSERLVKSLVYRTAEGFVFVLVRGDHQVDEGKREAALGESRPAEPEEVRALAGADIGFVSPFGLTGVRVLADPVLEGTTGLVAGANENDFHLLGVDMERDIPVNRYVPLRAVQQSDPCARCGMPLDVSRAIEVGHIFKLGTRYAESLGAYFLDETGMQKPVIMGSYGIGVERIMACAIELYFKGTPDYATHNPGCPDGGAMAWPREIAPFVVEILPLNVNNEETRELSEQLYAALEGNGVVVLLDDRDDRAGVKFKDADLFGSPVIVVIGERNLKEGRAEVRIRDWNVTALVETAGIESYVLEALGKGK